MSVTMFGPDPQRLGHEKANLLGSLLTTQFQLGAMARSTVPEEGRRDFYLFIDEFQNFSTDAFASILAEARKYRLCLTLSHQYIDQLSLPIREAVFGNVGTLITFRIGYADTAIMENEFGKAFSASTLADLDRYEAAVSSWTTVSIEARFGQRCCLLFIIAWVERTNSSPFRGNGLRFGAGSSRRSWNAG